MPNYLKITLDDGRRFLLRVVRETPLFVRGIEVNAEGDEVVPPGAHQLLHIIDRGRIAKIVQMRMNPKYATLEPAPPRGASGARARLVNIVTDTATLAEAMYPAGGLGAFHAGAYEGTRIPVRKLTGREIVTVAGTTAGAKVLADETWISDRFGELGARQIKQLRALVARKADR
jgi:hypothetical protein